MNTLLNYKNVLAVAFLLIAVTFAMLVLQRPESALGSTYPGGEYNSTTTVGMASVQNVISANRVVSLGSIIVASSSATTFKVWNATSTTDVASTSVFAMKAAIGEGTYTFDTELTRGLIIEKPTGFNGEYVITYRAQ